jgi:predicted nucleic acid-binding protein
MATTFAVSQRHNMRDEGITAALTGDKHFEQAGFTALLK